jgi:tripartite-type tricarboxylate transporter receptor subunit TctC
VLTRRSLLAASVFAAGLAPYCSIAHADDYPSGPVKILVAFPPGASTDVIMRAVAAKLQPRLGKAVIVENKAGASGLLAAGDVAKADPDGLTLLAAPSSLASNPTLYKSMPFDTLKDLAPVSLVFRTPLVLIANSSLPVKSVDELIALLKQKPGQIYYAHGGPGSAINLAAELFQTMTNTKMNGVSYRGTLPALNDLIGGQVQLMFADIGGAMGQINAGQVRALAVTSSERVPSLPKVPTIAEAGVPGFNAEGWTLVCAPAATPQSIVDKLSAEINVAVATLDVQNLIIQLGTLPTKSPPPSQLKAFLASEIDRWGKLIEHSGAAKSL